MSNASQAQPGHFEKEMLQKWVNTGAIVLSIFFSAHYATKTLETQARQFEAKAKADREEEDKKRAAQKEAENELRERELQQREKEYSMRFYERQLEVYLELCDVVARIPLAINLDAA